ncbi:MAG: hypothetical protein KUG78_20750 [Kangiellaceae bacterium]|nr:hypothetical protein [Kangiellaceae bacterium]
MRLFVFALSVLLTACVTKRSDVAKNNPAYHCPGFSGASWSATNIPEADKSLLITKQKFAVPATYQTLWFKSKSKNVGLCIVPDKPNRGSRTGCGSAYAIFTNNQDGWQLKDQKATICSR